LSKETYIIIKKNKNKGLESFYNRYGKKLFSYGVNNWQIDEDSIWDIIYSTYEKISNKIHTYSFENEEKFGSFVMVSFLNNIRNFYRDNKRQIEIVTEDPQTIHMACENPEENENTESEQIIALKAELEKLEDWERILLLLKAQQMPYSEIAKYIDKPENQLKVYYARLKKKITENMTKKTEVDHE